MHTEIEWDLAKAASNFDRHGVRFEEAASTLLDPMALAQEDESSEGEARWVLIGMSDSMRLLTVIYTLRDTNRIRLISARGSYTKGSFVLCANNLIFRRPSAPGGFLICPVSKRKRRERHESPSC